MLDFPGNLSSNEGDDNEKQQEALVAEAITVHLRYTFCFSSFPYPPKRRDIKKKIQGFRGERLQARDGEFTHSLP